MKLEATTRERLGQARKVIVTEDESTILGGAGDESRIAARPLRSEQNSIVLRANETSSI